MDADFVRRHVTVRGQEHIDLERGGFIIGAHLGNWEWMAPVVFALGGRTAEVVRPLDDPRLDAFVDRTRRSTGVVTIPKTGAGPELLRLLRDGCIVGVLVDQSPRENGVPVQFYGKPCWGTVAPVMVAARARKPAYPIAMTRDANGRYTVEFAPPIEMVRSGDLRADLIENSQRCQSAIEELVRRHPEQWLWLHRRWKPRPRLEAEWQERNRRGGTEE